MAKKYAVITTHSSLPAYEFQKAGVAAWMQMNGFQGDELVVVHDDVRHISKTNNWWQHLPHRSKLLHWLERHGEKDDQVFFADLSCLGHTEAIAEKTIAHLQAAKVTFWVHVMPNGGAGLFKADELRNVPEILSEVNRIKNRRNQAAHMKRIRKKEKAQKKADAANDRDYFPL